MDNPDDAKQKQWKQYILEASALSCLVNRQLGKLFIISLACSFFLCFILLDWIGGFGFDYILACLIAFIPTTLLWLIRRKLSYIEHLPEHLATIENSFSELPSSEAQQEITPNKVSNWRRIGMLIKKARDIRTMAKALFHAGHPETFIMVNAAINPLFGLLLVLAIGFILVFIILSSILSIAWIIAY